MESVSPQHTDRKQQSAQHEKKATQFLQAKVYSTASIFLSQSAIGHMMKHLQRDDRRVKLKIHSFIHINLIPLQYNVKVKQYIFAGMLHLMKNYYHNNNSNNNIIIAKYNIISKIIMSALSILLMALALNHCVCMTVDCRVLAQ